jgi:hypothetical protein
MSTQKEVRHHRCRHPDVDFLLFVLDWAQQPGAVIFRRFVRHDRRRDEEPHIVHDVLGFEKKVAESLEQRVLYGLQSEIERFLIPTEATSSRCGAARRS